MMQPRIALKKRPFPGEQCCGDQLDYWQDEANGHQCITCCVVDGLGHGTNAQDAACMIMDYVAQHRNEPAKKLFLGCDAAMSRNRGGVMAVAWIAGDQLTYASVGNITGYLIDGHTTKLGSHKVRQLHMDRGMIGGGFRRLSVQKLTLHEADLLIMHSDGVTPVFNLEPWLAPIGDNDKLATALLKDQGKSTDDACVLVYQHVGETTHDT